MFAHIITDNDNLEKVLSKYYEFLPEAKTRNFVPLQYDLKVLLQDPISNKKSIDEIIYNLTVGRMYCKLVVIKATIEDLDNINKYFTGDKEMDNFLERFVLTIKGNCVEIAGDELIVLDSGEDEYMKMALSLDGQLINLGNSTRSSSINPLVIDLTITELKKERTLLDSIMKCILRYCDTNNVELSLKEEMRTLIQKYEDETEKKLFDLTGEEYNPVE